LTAVPENGHIVKPDYYARMLKKILASMVLVPLVPFGLVLITGYFYFTTSLETNTVSNLKRLVEDHRQMIDTFLRERRANLEFVIRTHSFEDVRQPEKLRNIFYNLRWMSAAFVDLGVFDENGLHVAYHGPYDLTGKNYKEEPWFSEVMQTGVHISDVFLGFRGVPHFIIAVAWEEKEITWILRATIDAEMFNDMVRRVRIGNTGEAYIINKDGLFQTEQRSGGRLLEQDPSREIYLKHHSGIQIFIGRAEEDYYFYETILPNTLQDEFLYATTWLLEKPLREPWLLVVRQEKQDAFQALRSAMYLIVLITGIGGAAIIILAFNQTHRIIRHMEKTDSEKLGLVSQLIRATRLAELGQMAAGFAHEINNPLQIMRSEQALMKLIMEELTAKNQITDLEALKQLEDSILQIVLQIDRCANITHSILNFGRKSDPLFENIQLAKFVPEIINMVAHKAGIHGIELRKEIDQLTPLVHADKGQLQQVLLNLFNNAIDAIVDRHGSQGGELVVKVGPNGNNGVEIAVTDNGVGITPENHKKIFTPFFTTKPVGKGTGLGLSVCYGIIDGLGGSMEVSSSPNEGTTFFIHLPQVKA
jgi:two-component system, NtrC family, sensor kinase